MAVEKYCHQVFLIMFAVQCCAVSSGSVDEIYSTGLWPEMILPPPSEEFEMPTETLMPELRDNLKRSPMVFEDLSKLPIFLAGEDKLATVPIPMVALPPEVLKKEFEINPKLNTDIKKSAPVLNYLASAEQKLEVLPPPVVAKFIPKVVDLAAHKDLKFEVKPLEKVVVPPPPIKKPLVPPPKVEAPVPPPPKPEPHPILSGARLALQFGSAFINALAHLLKP